MLFVVLTLGVSMALSSAHGATKTEHYTFTTLSRIIEADTTTFTEPSVTLAAKAAVTPSPSKANSYALLFASAFNMSGTSGFVHAPAATLAITGGDAYAHLTGKASSSSLNLKADFEGSFIHIRNQGSIIGVKPSVTGTSFKEPPAVGLTMGVQPLFLPNILTLGSPEAVVEANGLDLIGTGQPPTFLFGGIGFTANMRTAKIKGPSAIGLIGVAPQVAGTDKTVGAPNTTLAETSRVNPMPEKEGNPVNTFRTNMTETVFPAKVGASVASANARVGTGSQEFKRSINQSQIRGTLAEQAAASPRSRGTSGLGASLGNSSDDLPVKAPKGITGAQGKVQGTDSAAKAPQGTIGVRPRLISIAAATVKSDNAFISELDNISFLFSSNVKGAIAGNAGIAASVVMVQSAQGATHLLAGESSIAIKAPSAIGSIGARPKIAGSAIHSGEVAHSFISVFGNELSSANKNPHPKSSLSTSVFVVEPGLVPALVSLDGAMRLSGVSQKRTSLSGSFTVNNNFAGLRVRTQKVAAHMDSKEGLSVASQKTFHPSAVMREVSRVQATDKAVKVSATSIGSKASVAGIRNKVQSPVSSLSTVAGLQGSAFKRSTDSATLQAAASVTTARQKTIRGSSVIGATTDVEFDGEKITLASARVSAASDVQGGSASSKSPSATLRAAPGTVTNGTIPFTTSGEVGVASLGLGAYAFISQDLLNTNIAWAVGDRDWLVTLSTGITRWQGYNEGVMAKANDLTPIASTDTRTIGWDYRDELIPGTYIVGVLKTSCEVYQGYDPNAAHCLQGDAQVANSPQPPSGSGINQSVVLQQFSNGVPGTIYTLTCQVRTNNAEEITIWTRLPITEAS